MLGRFWALLGLSLFLSPLRASAGDCGPAPDVDLRHGEAAVQVKAWEDWCVACGGVVDRTESASKCLPGTNWKGPASSSATNEQKAMEAAANALNAGMQGQSDIAAGFGLLGAAHLFAASLEDSAARSQARRMAELARQQQLAEERQTVAASEARLARERDEQAIAALKPSGSRDLAVRSLSGDEASKVRQDHQWDGAAPLPDPDAVDLRGASGNAVAMLQAPETTGGPVARCDEEQQAVDMMRKGLGPIRTSIEKTEEQLREAAKNAQTRRAEAQNLTVRGAVVEAREIATRYLDLVQRAGSIAGWKPGADPKSVRHREIYELVNELRKQVGGIDENLESAGKIRDSAKAGYEIGKELSARTTSMAEKIEVINAKMDEAGIWSEAGETLAGTFGPGSEAAFRMAELSIRVGVTLGDAMVSENEAKRAQQNLATMRSQYRRIDGDIAQREARLKDVRARNGCL